MRKQLFVLLSLCLLFTNTCYGGPNHWVKITKKGFKSFVAVGVTTITTDDKGVMRLSGGDGSGVFVSRDGLILTAGHVTRLEKGEHLVGITILVHDGRELNAEVVKVSTSADLALLKVSGYKSVPVSLGNAVETGEDCLLIGNPLGLMRTVTSGIISCSTRNLGNLFFTQTDASAQHGSSGGPLLNYNGKLIGILSKVIVGTGFNFAVPLKEIKEFLASYRPRYKLGQVKEKI